jgi:predicted metal-dependent hydrolase
MQRKTVRKPATVGTYQINLGKEPVSYTLKRSPTARYVRLEIRPEQGLIVTLTKRSNEDFARKFIKQKEKWILNHLEKRRKLQSEKIARENETGDTVAYLGEDLQVKFRDDPEKPLSVKREGQCLYVNLDHSEVDMKDAANAWCRLQAAKLIRTKADWMSIRMGINYGKASLRGQRTRWGSCSHKGNLSFNWKLVRSPEPVIEYVVVHELAHIREMNHSKDFWNLVSKYCPQYKVHRKWLRDHEYLLAD